MAEGKGAANPQAALEKYKYPGADKDDAIIAKVENAISHSLVGSWAHDDKAPVNASDKEKADHDAHDALEKAKKENPDEFKKAGTPPPLAEGQAKAPPVKAPNVDKTAANPKEQKAGAAKKLPDKGGAGAHANAGGAAGGGAEHAAVKAAVSGGMSDAELDKFLNSYSPKSKETQGEIDKIKQMSAIAKGFDGQLDKYISNGSALDAVKGKAVEFLGKKNVEAMFGDSPYAKVGGTLGKIMVALGRIKGLAGTVGDVCGKLGGILTIIGLLAMIFPPIGGPIEGIARILNVIGIVCTAVSFAISAILTALNGVVLAKQIAKGGSAEEKAATADLMMSEANDAASGFISLAQTFGGKFMKGFLGNSKGIVGGLLAKAKAQIGKIVAKATGPVKNWAKKLVYKVGAAFKKEESGPSKPGLLDKFNAFRKNADNTKVGKWLNKVGDKTNALATKMETKVVGNTFDKLGEKAGGADIKGIGAKAGHDAEEIEKQTIHIKAQQAAQDAENKERIKIEKEIAEHRKTAEEKKAEAKAAPTKKEQNQLNGSAGGHTTAANKLEATKDDKIDEAGIEGAKEFRNEHRLEEAKEEWKKAKEAGDPQQFNNGTIAKRAELKEKEELLAHAEGAEKHNLKKEVGELKEEINARMHARQPEKFTALGLAMEAKHAYGEVKENWAKFKGNGEDAEKAKELSEFQDKQSGKKERESKEQSEGIEEVHAETEKDHPQSGAEKHVEGMLSGVGHHEDHAHDQQPEGGNGGGEKPGAQPAPGSQHANDHAAAAGGGAGGDHHPAPAEAKAPEPKAAEGGKDAKEGGDAETGALAYWPSLVNPGGGDFGKALTDLQQMRRVGIEFKKSQHDAKKKAMDTLALYGKYDEYAKKKQEQAAQHKQHIGETKAEATQAGQKADEGSTHSGEAGAKQDEGKSSAQPVPVDIPKAEGGGFFARIFNKIKNWAADKARRAFAWLQEKIASAILQGLCGVSMKDMQEYTQALRHRMQFSKGTAETAEGTTQQTEEKEVQLDGKINNSTKEALDQANECDKNVADADKFLQDVDHTEGDIMQEVTHAKQFIAQVHAEAAAEKQRQAQAKKKKEDDEKKQIEKAKADDKKAAATQPKDNVHGNDDHHDDHGKAKKDAAKPEVSDKDIGAVRSAAGYVSTQVKVDATQLAASQQEQAATLSTKLDGKNHAAKKAFADGKVGLAVVDNFKKASAHIESAMGTVQSASIKTTKDLDTQVASVKSAAKELDSLSNNSFTALNDAFKDAYVQIAAAGKSLGSKIADMKHAVGF